MYRGLWLKQARALITFNISSFYNGTNLDFIKATINTSCFDNNGTRFSFWLEPTESFDQFFDFKYGAARFLQCSRLLLIIKEMISSNDTSTAGHVGNVYLNQSPGPVPLANSNSEILAIDLGIELINKKLGVILSKSNELYKLAKIRTLLQEVPTVKIREVEVILLSKLLTQLEVYRSLVIDYELFELIKHRHNLTEISPIFSTRIGKIYVPDLKVDF